MSTFTEYPVFEPNQVLSYTHLNGLVDYLEEQDRLTRRKLIGIGIACGMKVNWQTGPNMLSISKGVAVTSHGYIICLEDNFYDRYLPYSLPEQSMELNEDDLEEAPYPFLHDASGNEIDMWELVATDFVPEEGEQVPDTLTEAFLDDKVVMVYLECERESLRNCDINDCSDKGAKMTFDVRVLAINESDAITILQTEEDIAQLPVHQHEHPKYDLGYETLEKINPSRFNIKNFQDLFVRIADIGVQLNGSLPMALTDSFEAYEYLLREVYPEDDFPSGPFHDFTAYLSNVSADFNQNILSLQYLYDYYYDVVQGYNEFVALARRLTAECCPHPDRFPKHVLLGRALNATSAFLPDPSVSATAFDPLSAQTGLAPGTTPLAYRHYFIPAMIFSKQDTLLQKIRSVHYRLYLTAYRYDTEIMNEEEIKITPSKDGDYMLSEKAIPFYYNFTNGDDFHTNWSYDKTVASRLDRVFSYRLIDNNNHILLNKMEGHNFYRVEGHVGKGLATVLKDLSAQKKSLGLSFAIEPIFIGITGNDKADENALRDLTAAAQQLFVCKMRDLDVIFLILIAVLFYLLFLLLSLLSRIGGQAFGFSMGIGENSVAADGSAMFTGRNAGDFINKKIVRGESDQLLAKIRKEKGYVKGTVTKALNKDLENENTSALYLEVNAQEANTDLRNRTMTVVKTRIKDTEKAKKVTDDLYPTIALVDSTEEVMKSLSADSITEFDFNDFSRRHENFVVSYKNFMAQEPSEQLKKNSGYQEARSYAAKNVETLAKTETQGLFSNLSAEFSERFLNILSDLTLQGYAKKYPGLEHKAGVKQGGTLVLLYAHEDFVQKEFAILLDDIKNRFTTKNNLGATGNFSDITDFNHGLNTKAARVDNATLEENSIIARATASNDPLDNFVVLGDFCLPDRCCDSNCDDLYDEEVEIRTGTLTGTVTNERTQEILPGATVTAANTGTGTELKTTTNAKGRYELGLPAASYRVSVSYVGFKTVSQTRAISVGQNTDLPFKLRKTEAGLVLVGDIVDGTAGYDVNTDLGKEALRYYGSRYTYYNAYAMKLEADAASDTEKEIAKKIKETVNTITSSETSLTKLNNEIKRANKELVQIMVKDKNKNAKASLSESIKTINSAYLDKLSLVSREKLTPGTKSTLNAVEKITKKSGVNISATVKDWTTGYNLSEKPKILDRLVDTKIK